MKYALALIDNNSWIRYPDGTEGPLIYSVRKDEHGKVIIFTDSDISSDYTEADKINKKLGLSSYDNQSYTFVEWSVLEKDGAEL